MKKQIIAILILIISIGIANAQNKQTYAKVSVAFYNLENLFDTIDGENNDEEFLPNGARGWTEERYKQKLHNMAYAISQIASSKGPDVIGVSEIENRGVLEDLIAQDELKDLGYSIAHFDSPDKRGIDCALLYKASIFKLSNAVPHPVVIPNEEYIKTRDVLEVTGTILGEEISFLVGHWPSRAGGEEISLRRRMAAALVMKNVTDSLQKQNPNIKVVLMGDLNDDPSSPSVKKGLNTIANPENMDINELFNPFENPYKDGNGTLAYRDVWNLFDQIIVNKNLIDDEHNTLSIYKNKKTGYYGNIFNAKFLTDQTGRFKGYPHRTFSYGQFINGYSDHYPTYIYLVKKVNK